jgi:uncharacterized protein (DUF1015 family)
VPQIRPFRALRFDPSAVGDIADVLAPPYPAIDDDERDRLLARHPANIVRVDLPELRSGDEPDDRFRRAARALAEWRSSAVLHKDPHPSIYVYERVDRSAVNGAEHRQLGYFGRLRLEPLGPETGIVAGGEPAGPDADVRYRLMRATGVNSSAVVGVYDDPTGQTHGRLGAAIDRPADADATDVAGVHHRLWAMPADGDAAATIDSILAPAVDGPVSIVAGRSTYDSALRYRDERRMSRSCEEDPAFDYVLALLLERSEVTDDPAAVTGLVLNPHEW